ncbi:hypothetical protein VB145_21255 [Xanthomonas arboricola]|uniref:hypothetical protein n=1 Tax=Xanthomonas arboricola TaxID=56448 RepID=UPI000B02CF38|nr:hypothetical protein [Xanthomonas arboricola]MDN0243785.1 hypothetical protein [Xanthomonas arboricola pv. juglandis]MDN0256335.1 hypothetical protein [Xanthomonas arboricola pv. juglandis]MDN0260447.1 hypothetical protein [Xanthomonas arboricola pv. juglandis]MDN0264476.1 hypothetical protein [Xanthomonas arboricola pv. juglandis]MEA5150881.1 hypothetical protein [Xanthomonas arboricola]
MLQREPKTLESVRVVRVSSRLRNVIVRWIGSTINEGMLMLKPADTKLYSKLVGISIGIGAAVGAALGAAMGNLPQGLGLGLSLGSVFGIAWARRRGAI